jgi:hypothetical protein
MQQAPLQQAPMQQAPMQAPAPQPMPMQGQPMPQQRQPAPMLPTPFGGFQAAPQPMQGGQQQPMQVGAQPGYSVPPESSVVLPKSKAGLYIVLAVVGLLVVGGALGVVFYLRGRAAVAAATDTKPESTQTAAPPPASTAAAAAPPTTAAPASSSGTAATPPPVETQDASSAAATTGPSDAGATPAAQGGDAAAAAVAELIVVCVPDCDSVKIDDKALDTTDAGVVAQDPVQVSVGPHTIAVGKASYLAQSKKVTAKAGQQKVSFFLTKPGAAAPVVKPKCGQFFERCPK